jgi:hypothetical protein
MMTLEQVVAIKAWNAAIEAAAALLELDDEILPYTIEQIRKLKK